MAAAKSCLLMPCSTGKVCLRQSVHSPSIADRLASLHLFEPRDVLGRQLRAVQFQRDLAELADERERTLIVLIVHGVPVSEPMSKLSSDCRIIAGCSHDRRRAAQGGWQASPNHNHGSHAAGYLACSICSSAALSFFTSSGVSFGRSSLYVSLLIVPSNLNGTW
jgi:hypothetical protein